jgi:hypothetical protein
MDTLVYIWRRPCGEPFYVGIGREGRQNSRLRNRHTNSVRGSIERSGGSVIVEIVMRGTREECIAEEARLIALHGRVCDGGTLTNVTVGGECGVPGLVHSEESRAQMSESHRGQRRSDAHRDSLRRAMTGQVQTAEARRKTSEGMRGNKNSLGHRQTPEHIARREASRLATLARKRLAAAHGPLDESAQE